MFFVCNGCSNENRPDGLPPLFPVTLTILLDDQPIDSALVILYTEDKAIANWTIGSVTDADGKAIIVTHGQFRGAPAGKFKVCVSKRELPRSSMGSDMPSIVGPQIQPTAGMPQVIEHVDPIFGKPESSPLEIEVSPQRKMMVVTLNVHKPK